MAVLERAAPEPTQRVSRRWTAALSVANLGLFMAYFGPLAVLLPNQVQDIAGQHKVVAFGWVTGLGALVAVVANPLAGALSDRTTSRFGRRRTWTLAGALLSAVALVLLASRHTIAGVAAGWCLAQAGLNRPGVRHLPIDRPGADHPGPARRRRARPGPRGDERGEFRRAGPGPGDRRSGRHLSGRLLHVVLLRGRDCLAWCGGSMARPLCPLIRCECA
jgi:hypothetical protein